jgi:inositol phosphorylceramide mannosyltransferase catalytic subunit
MIPRILHSVWFGGAMPEDVAVFAASVRNHHPAWSHMRWDESSIATLGLTMESLMRMGPWASISNFVRLMAVEKFGGIYLDSDCECFRPLDPLLSHAAFGALQDDLPAGQNSGRICNAVFGAEPGHPWLRWQLFNMPLYESTDAAWGVYLMSEAPRHGVTLIDPKFIFPFHWETPPTLRTVPADSFIAHHWKGSWSKK